MRRLQALTLMISCFLVGVESCKRTSRTYVPSYMSELCERGNPYNMDVDKANRLQPSFLFYEPNMNCTVIFKSKMEYLYIEVRKLHMEVTSGCHMDRLTLYDKANTEYVKMAEMCDNWPDSRVYKSSQGEVAVNFVSGKKSNGYGGFEIIVTAFTSGPLTWPSFNCDNGRTINGDLTCDGFDNCGDNTDEISTACQTWCGWRCQFAYIMMTLTGVAMAIGFVFIFIGVVRVSKARQQRHGKVGSVPAASKV